MTKTHVYDLHIVLLYVQRPNVDPQHERGNYVQLRTTTNNYVQLRTHRDHECSLKIPEIQVSCAWLVEFTTTFTIK